MPQQRPSSLYVCENVEYTLDNGRRLSAVGIEWGDRTRGHYVGWFEIFETPGSSIPEYLRWRRYPDHRPDQPLPPRVRRFVPSFDNPDEFLGADILHPEGHIRKKMTAAVENTIAAYEHARPQNMLGDDIPTAAYLLGVG